VWVAHDHFSSKHQKRRGWSDERRSKCGAASNDWFLGGYCNFADHKVTKTFHRLPVHTHLRLTARFHFFDKWEGQYAYAMVNDQVVWVQNHRHGSSIFASGCKGIDVCGDSSYSDRLSTGIDITVKHDNRKRHPRLASIELRALGLEHDPAPAAAKALRAAKAKAKAKAKANGNTNGATDSAPLMVAKPSLTSDPAATNRFVDIEGDDDGKALAGEPLPVKGKGKGHGKGHGKGKSKSSDLTFAIPHFNNTDAVTITFGAVMPLGDPCIASWGVDDVQLYAMVQQNDPRYD